MARLAVGMIGAAIGGMIAGPVGARIGFAIGSAAADHFLQPDINVDGPRLQDAAVTSSSYGQILPIVWGVYPVAGNVIDASPVRTVATSTSSGGKGGGPSATTTTYTYFGDLCVAVCEGEIDDILLIRANGQVIYNADPDADIAKPDWLKFTVYKGSETQQPDPTFEAIHGAGEVSAYRGTAYVVFEDFAFSEFGNQFAITFEFVVARSTSSGLTRQASVVSTSGSISNDASIVHDPYHDILIVGLTGDAESSAVGINPYTREVVWRTPNNGYWATEGLDLAAREIPLGLDCIATAGRFAMLRRVDEYGAIDVVEVDAGTGAIIRQIDVADSNSGFGLAGLAHAYHDNFCYGGSYWTTQYTVLPIALQYTNVMTVTTELVSVDPPTGWYWNNLICSDGNGTILAELQDTPINSPTAFALVFIDVPQTLSIPFEIDEPLLAVTYCSVSDSFLCTSGIDGVFFEVDRSGIVQTIDFDADYGISDTFYYNPVGRGIAYSSTEHAAYVQGANAIYRIDLNDPTTAPRQWAFGVSDPIMLYHAPSDRVWWSPDGTNSAYSMRLNSATGNPATLDDIVSDLSLTGTELSASDIDVTALATTEVKGFAVARPMPRRNALAMLQTAFLFDYVARDGVLTGILRGQSSSATLDDDDIGAYIEGGSAPAPWTIKRQAASTLPQQFEVTFVDPDKSHEPGAQLARRQTGEPGRTQRIDLAVSLSNDEAAQIADTLLHLAHIEAEQYTSTLMPSRIDDAQPAAVLTTTHDGVSYTYRVVEASIIDGRMIQLMGHREIPEVFTGYAVGGAPRLPGGAVSIRGSTVLWALDLPMLRTADNNSGIYLAASSHSPGWPGCIVQRSADGVSFSEVATIATAATMGSAINAPTTGVPMLWDAVTALQVQLMHGTLASTDRTAPTYACWGINGRWEVIGFTTATQQADGSWLITDLARGLLDTGGNIAAHEIGDQFVVLSSTDLTRIDVPSAQIDETEYLRGVTVGRTEDTASVEPYGYTAQALVPYAPVALHAETDGSGNWDIAWRRQDRNFVRAWYEQPNTEAIERYQVTIYNDSSQAVRTVTVDDVSTYQYTTADQTTDFGDTQTKLIVGVAQVSSAAGAGHEARMTVGADYGYVERIIAEGPYVFHTLDDQAGTTMIDVMGTVNGSYVNSPTLADTPVMTGSNAIGLDGSNYAEWNYPGSADTEFIQAVEFAFVIDEIPASGEMALLGTNYDAGNEGQAFRLTIKSDGKLRLRHWRFGTSPLTPLIDIAGAALSVGTRYHVILNMELIGTRTDTIYINGALYASGSAAADLRSPAPGVVRYGWESPNYTGFPGFKGRIDNVSWWDHELDATTRADHFLRGGIA